MRMHTRRRGVLLLVVLSMLVLFVLAGTTFLVVAGHYRRAAEASARRETNENRPRRELDRALYQLLRGTHRGSSLFGHSLLEDLYGNDEVRGITTFAGEESGGRATVIRFRPDRGRFSQIPSHYDGLPLTVLSGRARGASARVTSYRPGMLQVEPLVGEDGQRAIPTAGDRFLIHGRPLNGTGAGYNPASGKLDATLAGAGGDDAVPVALLPHVAKFNARNASAVAANIGGADESWDVADYQNMFLAAPALGIPSFHRPSLIQYWMKNRAHRWSDPNFRRLVILRPMAADHPNFTGSNPAMRGSSLFAENIMRGPWDVDNDGDGRPDSIWLDLGAPVQGTADGRLFKPLFAILCVDLDGRLNVNAHANSAQLDPPRPSLGIKLESVAGSPLAESLHLPTGRGYGFAEISLSPVFGTEVKNLLFGRGTLLGRYGADFLPGSPQTAGAPRAGTGVTAEFIATGITTGGQDLRGIRGVVLDHTGYPLTITMPVTARRPRNPYAADPLRGSSASEATFTVAEMERLLRSNDIDSTSLPDRLARLTQRTFRASGDPSQAARYRSLFTTRSVDLAVPNMVGPVSFRRPGAAPGHIADLTWRRLSAAGVSVDSFSRELRRLLPAELLAGRRMNINPAIGNGRDDNGNGVIDEPLEAAGERTKLTDSLITNPVFARQVFARHLFCLAMILTDREDARVSSEQREMSTWRLAQWAINVVDFCDRDSIMSPFEFDINPFNGWQPMDGDVATDEGGDRRVTWGCEYPELLITETLAVHDRRVKDTDDDNGPHAKRWNPDAAEDVAADPDLDQYRIPSGQLFMELYATRGPVTSRDTNDSPRELYEGGRFLDLGRLAPKGEDGLQYPVWRIAITKADIFDAAVQRPDVWMLDPTDRWIERTIWFAAHDPRGLPNERGIYYHRNTARPARVARGQYAVVGPRPIAGIGRNVILVAAKPPRSWLSARQTAPGGIGISVSEPVPGPDYYPEPTIRSPAGSVDTYGPIGSRVLPDRPLDNVAGRPLAQPGVPSTGTIVNFRSAFLQRLADPLRPHHSLRNPYITVDWATIDLTVFNGEDQPPAGYPLDKLGPFDPSHSASPDLPLRFASRQRGGSDGNVWAPMALDPPPIPAAGSSRSEYLTHGPLHTLGRLNSTLSSPGPEPRSRGLDAGSPPLPFPWLTWYDGPFVSPYGLMLVPSSSPSRLPYEFNVAAHFGAPTGHLLDFSHRADDRSPDLCRIFDCVGLPPPSGVSRASGMDGNEPGSDPARAASAPANRPPRLRYPGRVNLNTMVDPLVWRGVAKNFPPMDSERFFSRIVQSREGYDGKPSSSFPTRFANPFRAAAGSDLMPLKQLRRKEAEATFLRSDPINRRALLFAANPAENPEVLSPYRNQNRNAFFYYQGLLRLGNLVTTHSNVFAIWITVGYFEVRPHSVDLGHPDGYQLDRELGEETGEIKRHRAFYIVDRSIPVAYQRGRNHNVDRTILVRRFIE